MNHQYPRVFHYPKNQLLEVVNEHLNGQRDLGWCFFRDLMLDAEKRGLLSLYPQDDTFWQVSEKYTSLSSNKVVESP